MKYQLLVRPEAQQDLAEAVRWYEEKQTGLGRGFLLRIHEAMNGIIRNPHKHAVIHRDVRRSFTRRFPYGIFYRMVGQTIVVLGVFHARRDPGRWQSRT